MAQFPELSSAQLEAICRSLGEATTGSGIDQHMQACAVEDTSMQSTKWRRLYETFDALQRQHRSSAHLARFTQSVMAPSAFVNREEEFQEIVGQLNQQLAFSGLSYKEDGQFHRVAETRTLSEAQKRARLLDDKLHHRNIHEEVYKYSRPELLEDNYFHAVFEACKGLAQRIRDLSGIEGDGAGLVDQAFSSRAPILAINTLSTETEKSEQKGFANLLKGAFSAIRNPLAHEPKLLWQGIDDAVDYLTLISLLHRKLDGAVKIPDNIPVYK